MAANAKKVVSLKRQLRDQEAELDLLRTQLSKKPVPNPKEDSLIINVESLLDEIEEILLSRRVQTPSLAVIRDKTLWSEYVRNRFSKCPSRVIPKDIFEPCIIQSLTTDEEGVQYADPGRPTTPISFGANQSHEAFMDLGAAISLMPTYLHKRFGLRPWKPAPYVLRMADQTLIRCKGIVERVPIKILQFYYLVDFVLIDMDEHNVVDPLILGRPFLATANAKINCRAGRMSISYNGQTASLRFSNSAEPQFQAEASAYIIDVVPRFKEPSSPDSQDFAPSSRFSDSYSDEFEMEDSDISDTASSGMEIYQPIFDCSEPEESLETPDLDWPDFVQAPLEPLSVVGILQEEIYQLRLQNAILLYQARHRDSTTLKTVPSPSCLPSSQPEVLVIGVSGTRPYRLRASTLPPLLPTPPIPANDQRRTWRRRTKTTTRYPEIETEPFPPPSPGVRSVPRPQDSWCTSVQMIID